MDTTLSQLLSYLFALGQERDRLMAENKALRAQLPVEEMRETELATAVDALRANGQ